MNKYLNINNNVLSNKLKVYFKDNVKMSLKTDDKIFIVTKNDIYYKIIIYELFDELFLESNDYSIIEEMIVKELCFWKLFDLTYGSLHYIAKSEDNKFFYYDFEQNYYIINGEKLEKLELINSDSNPNNNELNDFSSDSKIVLVKCGPYHSLALIQKGEVYAWGYGQIGNGSDGKQLVPIKLDCFEGEKVIAISCGASHSMALTQNGYAFSWGDNKFGQLGNNGNEKSKTPKPIELENILITKISCRKFHSLLLSNEGEIYGFGFNFYGRIGNGIKEIMTKPTKLNNEKKFIDIASHWNFNISMALSDDKIFYVWDEYYKQSFSIPTESMFKSFDEIFAHYFEQNFEVSEEIIEFSDIRSQWIL
jgi:hypothetical protein